MSMVLFGLQRAPLIPHVGLKLINADTEGKTLKLRHDRSTKLTRTRIGLERKVRNSSSALGDLPSGRVSEFGYIKIKRLT